MARSLLVVSIGLAVLVATVFAAATAYEAKLVVLWTDALVFVLLLVAVIAIVAVRQRPYLLEPWRQVLQRPLAASAAVLLSAYLVVGVVDSVHFRLPLSVQPGQTSMQYSVDVLSLLDLGLAPLRAREEKTYSAPLATHLYAKELIELPGGRQVRDYPRLAHGGAHLADPYVDRNSDLVARTLLAVGQAAVIWIALSLVLVYLLARRSGQAYRTQLAALVAGRAGWPWRTILSTLGVLLLFVMLGVHLGTLYHLFGTDKVGQDVLYQSLKSIRTGLVIGTLTTLLMLPFALALGILAGYFRGWIDDVIQYVYTTLNSIPGVLLIAAAVLIVQTYIAAHPETFQTMAERADARLLFLCLILGVTSWTGLCRLLRGETLKLRELDYVAAAQAFGVPRQRILTWHVLPNVMHIVLISVVLDFSGLVLAEAVLSYVGVGVDPSMYSWGNMINSARLEMAREPMVWWSLLAAFAFMFVLVLAANLFADAVRDAFDPRLRQQV